MPFAVRHTVLGKLLAFLPNPIKCFVPRFFRLSICAGLYSSAASLWVFPPSYKPPD